MYVEWILGVLCSMLTVLSAVERKTLDDLTNTCLDGINHKSKPGAESSLFQQCAPWKNRSCCTKQITEDLHISDAWYKLDWNHCRSLSPKCRSHFLQDVCFYECSPNVGPWLEPVDMKIRNEKFNHVPLCETDCNNWWNDCKDDLTCLQNWGKNFNWTTGKNTCPTGTTCRTFSQVFSNATNFCETIWDQSWKVVPETEPCMHLWFDPVNGNPNDAVALAKANEIVNAASNIVSFNFLLFTLVTATVYVC